MEKSVARNGMVLILDDEEDPSSEVTHALRVEGYDVCVAPSGDDGFSMARDLRAAVILVSLSMPDISDIVVKIRTHPTTRSARLVAVTSYSGDAAHLARLAGFEACLVKPLDPVALLEVLRNKVRAMSLP